MSLLAKNRSEDQSHQRSAVEHLPADCHREVHGPGLDPGAECVLVFKENSGNQAHDRTHNAADADRNGIGDELWTIGRFHYGECEFLSNFSDNKKFQNEGNRNHNDHFMGSQQKGLTGYTTGIQGYIVYDHSVDHNGSHDNCVNCVFKFSFWQKNILLLIMSYVLFVIIRRMCVSNINNRFYFDLLFYQKNTNYASEKYNHILD